MNLCLRYSKILSFNKVALASNNDPTSWYFGIEWHLYIHVLNEWCPTYEYGIFVPHQLHQFLQNSSNYRVISTTFYSIISKISPIFSLKKWGSPKSWGLARPDPFVNLINWVGLEKIKFIFGSTFLQSDDL